MTVILNIWPIERRWKVGREGQSFVVNVYFASLRFMAYDFEWVYEKKIVATLAEIVRQQGLNVTEWWKNVVDAAKTRRAT